MGSPGLLQQVLPWTKKPRQRGHPATHLLCLVCGGDEDYERGELGRADDLEGLWREGCSYQIEPFPRLGASTAAMLPVMQ